MVAQKTFLYTKVFYICSTSTILAYSSTIVLEQNTAPFSSYQTASVRSSWNSWLVNLTLHEKKFINALNDMQTKLTRLKPEGEIAKTHVTAVFFESYIVAYSFSNCLLSDYGV